MGKHARKHVNPYPSVRALRGPVDIKALPSHEAAKAQAMDWYLKASVEINEELRNANGGGSEIGTPGKHRRPDHSDQDPRRESETLTPHRGDWRLSEMRGDDSQSLPSPLTLARRLYGLFSRNK